MQQAWGWPPPADAASRRADTGDPTAAGISHGPSQRPRAVPSAPPLVNVPRIAAQDVAAAVRRVVAARGAGWCRRAAASGVASQEGTQLLSAVLEDLARAHRMDRGPFAGAKGADAVRDAQRGPQPDPDRPMRQLLAWRLGVCVTDLLLYVDSAAAAMEQEQHGVRADAKAARPGGSGGQRAKQSPREVTAQYYGFSSPTQRQQQQQSRGQLKASDLHG